MLSLSCLGRLFHSCTVVAESDRDRDQALLHLERELH